MTTSKKHNKHPKITKSDIGQFSRVEFGFLGTHCPIIQNFCLQISSILPMGVKASFVDADHQKNDDEQHLYSVKYTDKIDFQRIDIQGAINSFHIKKQFESTDICFVNGNHFHAKHQVVFMDFTKKDSLFRKVSRLDNIVAIIKTSSNEEIYDFLLEKISDRQIPIFQLPELIPFSNFVLDFYHKNIPPIYGLVLAGGKSTRMGTDKALLDYHGKVQREWLYDMLSSLTDKCYISVKSESERLGERYLEDQVLGLGSFGAILTAFRKNPNVAWFTIACDLPLLDKSTLKYLISERNPSKLATAFYNPTTKFPEPLITIWEPKAYSALLEFMRLGYSCPRKVLINSDINMVNIRNISSLTNVNTPEEYQRIRTNISNRSSD